MHAQTRGTVVRQRGQILAIFALAATVIILGVGLVIDGGNALAKRRDSQNASDFAALAGARIIAQWIDGDTTNGTDANVKAAINNIVAANGSDPVVFHAADTSNANAPAYLNEAGGVTGWVGDGAPGAGPPTGTVGVRVATTRTFSTYFLGIIGMGSLPATTTATARGGYSTGGPAGDVFPAAIASSFFETYPFCNGAVGSSTECQPVHLTPGSLNVPGGFGWLKFGAVGKCAGYGLGMSTTDGCEENAVFLQTEIGPPPNSFGCCTGISGDDAKDRIGSLPGNKASADCSYYVDNDIVVTVPVWDYADGTGANAFYHIIGFAGFQLTGCPGGKNIEGVWRRVITTGPTSATSGYEFQSLAVQLIR
jgi:hypothetical protein